MDENLKVCTTCKEEKQLTEFHADNYCDRQESQLISNSTVLDTVDFINLILYNHYSMSYGTTEADNQTACLDLIKTG